MKAAELFVKCLESEGVECIFGIPGEENIDVSELLKSGAAVVCNQRQPKGHFAPATLRPIALGVDVACEEPLEFIDRERYPRLLPLLP